MRIRGGVAGNVIPDRCAVEVNFRFAPDRYGEQAAEAHLREVFAGYPVELTDSAPGALPGLDGRAGPGVPRRGRAATDRQARLDRRGPVRRAGRTRR